MMCMLGGAYGGFSDFRQPLWCALHCPMIKPSCNLHVKAFTIDGVLKSLGSARSLVIASQQFIVICCQASINDGTRISGHERVMAPSRGQAALLC